MIPAMPASTPEMIPSKRDLLNISDRLFSDGNGDFQLDLVADLPTGLAYTEICAVDGEDAGEKTAVCGAFECKGNGQRFLHAMHFQIARHLVSKGSLDDLLGSKMDLGIFCRIEPFIAFRMSVLQAVAGIDGRHIDRHIEFGCCGMLFVECDDALKAFENAGGLIARKGDGIAFGDLPVVRRNEGKSAPGQ